MVRIRGFTSAVLCLQDLGITALRDAGRGLFVRAGGQSRVRVARGPHWRWGDQDGGVGGVGTVTGRADESGWCTVTWDQGGSNAYRVGSFSMFDLCRWTPGPSGTPPPTVGRTTTAHARDDDQPQQELNAVGKGLWRPFDVVAAAALAGPSVRVCAVESSKQAKLGINFSRASCAWNIHVAYATCGFSSQSNTTDCRTLLTPLVRFQV